MMINNQVTMTAKEKFRQSLRRSIAVETERLCNAASYRAGWYARHDGQTIPPGASEAFIDGWMARHERHEAMVAAGCVEVMR